MKVDNEVGTSPPLFRNLQTALVSGFALFLAWYARLNLSVARAVRGDPALAALIPASATFVTVYMANSYTSNEFWMVAGILTAACAARVPARVPAGGLPASAPA